MHLQQRILYYFIKNLMTYHWVQHKISSDQDTIVSPHELDPVIPTILKDLILPAATHHKIHVMHQE